MDLDSFDRRIRHLERELARARWRTRAVCAAAVGAAVVFACKSKPTAADDKPPPPILELGNITLDGTTGTITTKFSNSEIMLSPLNGFVFSKKSGDGTSDKLDTITIGPSVVQLRSAHGAVADLSTFGDEARLGLQAKPGIDAPRIDLTAVETMTTARFGAQQREINVHVSDLGASLDLLDGVAELRSSVNGRRERGYAVVNASVDTVRGGIRVEGGKVTVGPEK